jgi:GAF domain-containing protein
MTEPTDSQYELLDTQLAALLCGEPDALANTANFVALLFNGIPRINWLGVYLLRGSELVLGPFQGKPACTRIPLSRGVCGTAAATLETQRVDDVHDFDGHIVCDPDSRSELVVPLVAGGELVGVLDIDSPHERRFDRDDQRGVERLCATFMACLDEAGTAALRAT